jgi:hypothetical protein
MNKNNLMAIKKKVTLHEKTRRERGKIEKKSIINILEF